MDKNIVVYDFETLVRFRAIKFRQSLEYGKVINHILSKINHTSLELSVQKLKHKYNSKDKFQNNLIHKYGLKEQKKQYVLQVLEGIKNKCYNFQKKHIEQIQKFNDYYYPDQMIQLPEQLKLRKCSACQHNNMFSKTSLQLHLKNCYQYKKSVTYQMNNLTGEDLIQNDSPETQIKEQTTKQNELLSNQESNQQLYNKSKQTKTKQIKKSQKKNKNKSKKINKSTPKKLAKSQHQQKMQETANNQINQQSLLNSQYNEIQQIYYNQESSPFREQIFDCLQLYDSTVKDRKLRTSKQHNKQNSGQKKQ